MSKKLTTSAAIGSLIATSVGMLSATPAHASATYTVTNCDTTGAGSLADGVDYLNNNSGGSISFNLATDCDEIVVSSILSVNQNIAISGPSDKAVTVTGQLGGNSVLFFLNANLSLSNLTFDGSYNVGGNEYTSLLSAGNGNITLESVHVNDMANGTAIQTYSGNVNIANSNFTDDNTARPVGFIMASGDAFISNTEFVGNAYGEGSLISATNLIVQFSTFTNNDASFGPDSLLSGNTVSIYDSNFRENDTSTLTIGTTFTSMWQSSVVANHFGGSIFSTEFGTMDIYSNTIAENQYGVGASVASGGSVKLRFNTFLNNEEANQGIGTIVQGDVTLGGNIFASDEGYAFRCLNVGSSLDLSGNLFTSQPIDCGLPTLPTGPSGGASAVVDFASLKFAPMVTSPTGKKYFPLGAGSVAIDYFTTFPDTNQLLDEDQRGEDRPFGAGYDVGAIEGAGISSCSPLAKVTVLFAFSSISRHFLLIDR